MTQTDTAIAIIRNANQLLRIGLAMLDGEDPKGLNPDSLKVALAMMEGEPDEDEDPDESTAPRIDPAWFKPGKNRHLTPLGIQFCYDWWKKGMTEHQTAQRMGIAWTAVRLRYAKFEAGETP